MQGVELVMPAASGYGEAAWVCAAYIRNPRLGLFALSSPCSQSLDMACWACGVTGSVAPFVTVIGQCCERLQQPEWQRSASGRLTAVTYSGTDCRPEGFEAAWQVVASNGLSGLVQHCHGHGPTLLGPTPDWGDIVTL